MTRQRKVLWTLLFSAINLFGRYLVCEFELPLIGNQLGAFAAAYLLGPFYGVATVIISGLLSYSFDSIFYVYMIPVMLSCLLVGVAAKKEHFLYNFYHMISIVCCMGLLEGIWLTVGEGILLHGKGASPYAEAIIQMLKAYQFSIVVRHLVAGIYVAYLDTLVSFLVLWVLHYMGHPFHKKILRREYLKRNTLKLLLFTLLLSNIMPSSLVVEAKTGDDNVDFIQRKYNAENGIAGGTANDILQSSDGTMWVATYEGLYRFNGQSFELIDGIPSVRCVMCIYLDHDGHMWIGNNGTGLVITNGQGKCSVLDSSAGLPSDNIRAIVQASDTIFYVGTATGLSVVYEDEKELKYLGDVEGSGYVYRLASNGRGTVALHDSNEYISIIQDQKVIRKIKIPGESVNTVDFDSEGNLYIGTMSNRIYKYKDLGNDYGMCQVLECGNLSSTTDFYFDNGFIYVAADNGIGYFDSKSVFHSIQTEDFDSSVDHIIKDYQGNYWFTSSRYGVLGLIRSGFTDVFRMCGVGEAVVNSETKWQGLLYVATDNGLHALDLTENKVVENSITKELEGIRVRCVNVDKNGSLWISTSSMGVIEITSDGEEYRYNSDLENYQVGNKARFTRDISDGTEIISSGGGIAYIKDHKLLAQNVLGDGFSNAFMLSVIEKKDGTILAGSDGEGVFVIKDGEVCGQITREDGLSSGVILRLLEDPIGDGVFVLTGSGLCYLKEDGKAYEIQGFPYYNNTDILITENETVFILSTAGVFVTSYDSLMSGGEVDTMLLDRKAGLIGSLTSNSWNYMDMDGTLYLSGNYGLYSFDTSDYGLQVEEYRPIIGAAYLDGEMIPTGQESTITVPSGVMNVELVLELNNYTPADPYIRYYLSGVDDTKQEVLASELGRLAYSNIPYGSHDLHVEILDNKRETVVSKIDYTIYKEKEIYEATGFRIYFYVTLILILLSMISTVTNIASFTTNRRQRNRYEKMVAKLEREKASAYEKALRREEAANKAKSDFLASISHEIRTPINAMLGMDTIISREAKEEQIRQYALDSLSAGETLLALVNDILDFSKIESGKMELVLDEYNLRTVVRDLANMVWPKTEKKGLKLEINVNPRIPIRLYGDEKRIKQVILNILNNAVKYTEKGSVSLNMEFDQLEENLIALKVSVVDTGIGIRKEDQKKLFEPFERLEENRNRAIEGTGLGLSITKQLLEKMDSRLMVESEYGQGSTFSFIILQEVRNWEQMGQFDRKSIGGAQKVLEKESFHAPEARLLVVDDSEINLIVVTNILKRNQLQMSTASSGEEAVELCREQEFDLILMDAMMPGINGDEALRIIREENTVNRKTPMIILTANAIKGAREDYMSKGFDDYLSKPINANILESMVENYLPREKVKKMR